MKIDNTGKTVTSYTSQPKQVRGTASTAATAQASSSESVDINPVASQMSEPAFDADKVEAIKQAISSGQFRFNPEAIADGLIKAARELAVG